MQLFVERYWRDLSSSFFISSEEFKKHLNI